MNVIKCTGSGVKEEWRLRLKATKSSHAFNFYGGETLRFYLRYPWKLLMQVLQTTQPDVLRTRLGCMKKVVLAVRR